MREALVAAAVMAVSACGETEPGQGGPPRTVAVRPTEASSTPDGFRLTAERNFKVRLWTDSGSTNAPVVDPDGFQVFEVPEGAALFEFAPRRFVYTSRTRLEPCGSTLTGNSTDVDFDIQLAQPAIEGDTLQVVGTSLPWVSHSLTLAAGGSTLEGRVSWSGQLPLGGSVTAVHRVKAPAVGDFERVTTVGVLEAGNEGTVRGQFRKLASAGELELPWDAASLDPIQRGNAVVASTELAALQHGLPIASVTTSSHATTTVPMLLPALEADSFTVKGLVAVVIDAQHTYLTPFGWQFGVNDTRELKLLHEPPGAPSISRSESKVSWLAAPIAPGVYVAKIMKPVGPFVFEVLGEIITDETSVPLPLPLRGPTTFVVLTAIRGEGISAASCAYHVERLPSWERLPVVGPLTE